MTLLHFMLKMAEKIKPIINLLKKNTHFVWVDDCKNIILELNNFLGSLPVIQKLIPSEPILVYPSVSEEAISFVLVQDVNGEHRPVYFVSRTLQEAETWYQIIEKVALVLVTTTRRMRSYFHNHAVIVKTNYPIVKILGNRI